MSRILGLPCALLAGAALCSAQTPPVPHFTEVSTAAGMHGFYLPGPMFGAGQMNLSVMGGGAAVGDFDRDGWQDVYVVVGGSSADQLFFNNADGTFSDQALLAGTARIHLGMGACVGDYDADGWPDVFVTSLGPASSPPAIGQHLLWRNNGHSAFVESAVVAGVNQSSALAPDGLGATFGDYNLDGSLDLFIAGWRFDSDGNRLLMNNGDATFTDVTVAAGLNNPITHGFSPEFVDMDGDRYPELLLAADFGTSKYYVNNGDGTFSDSTAASGLGLDGNGMGQCTGDFDADGRIDWYVTSIHSLNSGTAGIPGTGNMLYRNDGGHNFSEISSAAGVNDGGWGWGTVAADFNNDGLLDLAETNGFKQFNGSGLQEWVGESSYLFLNQGGANFLEASQQAGFATTGLGRGLAHLDYDNDGDQDLIAMVNRNRLRLYRNDSPVGGSNWLRVVLDTSASPYLAPDGIGSKIKCTISGNEQVRCLSNGCAYLSSSERVVHFGLRGVSSIDELSVVWNNGRVTYLPNVAANQELVVMYCPGDWNGRDGITALDYNDFRNDWLLGTADFNSDGVTNAQDFVEFLAAYNAGCP